MSHLGCVSVIGRQLVTLVGTTLPGAGVDIDGSAATPTTPLNGKLQYQFCPSAAGKLSVIYRKAGSADATQKLESDQNLAVGVAVFGEIICPNGRYAVFRYSVAGTGDLIVWEP